MRGGARRIEQASPVPRTLVSMALSGDRMLRSTCDSAAKCTTASKPALVDGIVDKRLLVADVAVHEFVPRVAR